MEIHPTEIAKETVNVALNVSKFIITRLSGLGGWDELPSKPPANITHYETGDKK